MTLQHVLERVDLEGEPLSAIRTSVLGAVLVLCAPAGAVTLHRAPAPPPTIVPVGYFVDSSSAKNDLPIDRVEADGDFTLAIHRKYDDPLGAHLLDVAESLYPPRDAIVQRAIERSYEMGGDSANTPLWWQDGLGVSRVPYAITAGAVAHYMALTDRFRAHNFRGAWDRNLFWSDFKYDATIQLHDHYYLDDTTLTNVYVAEMALAWSFDDGTFIPAYRSHRVVILGRDGSVLHVQGDGYTEEAVEMSSHRGIGRVQTLSR
jgi:hypothetical protein